MTEAIVLLHPGQMGSSIGAGLVANRHDVVWVTDGRSEATRTRADSAELRAVDTLTQALDEVANVISVCPPHAAVELAQGVHGVGFEGTYVDANAVAPATARRIEAIFGDRYVDGGIVGPPAWTPGATRLYLSGDRAEDVAAWFADGFVDARAIAGGPGAASALKMCYAAFTKGSSALILAIRALAEREGVTDALLAEWDISQHGLRDRSIATARSVSPKAWRFEAEMLEIAATFDGADLPGGFHAAAAEIYRRMSEAKNIEGGEDIEAVVARLLS
ncbi:MAG: DUF1932 domain-containing protein [Gammaproteobacteria bacterium]|nr:DUF1932 domain-containing protein [Gammaproteobacteria bacterium]